MTEKKLNYSIDQGNTMNEKDFVITKLVDGLGIGKNPNAAYEKIVADAGPDALAAAELAINSEAILTSIDMHPMTGKPVDDDGCPDGRGVKKIYHGQIEKERSLKRPKVFGGGATMAMATLVGVGAEKDASLHEAFEDSIRFLNEHMINFGAHSAEGANHGGSGCGAIDKAPEVIATAIEYKKEIKEILDSIGVDTKNISTIFENFENFETSMNKENYSGSAVVTSIIENSKIIKELTGTHKEMAIIMNNFKGHTVDQSLVRQATGDSLQVFAFDVWRVEEIAQKMYPDDAEKQHLSVLSQLVYSMGVAAVLTNGDLPVYSISERA